MKKAKKSENSKVKSIGTILIFVWVVLSSVYIVHDLWNEGLKFSFKTGYEKAQFDTINSIIDRAQICEAFDAFIDQKRVTLINVECLQKPEEEVIESEGEEVLEAN